MMSHELSRRTALRAIGSLPVLLAAGAAAGTREDFASALARNPRLIGFETARAEEFAAPLTTLSGRLPPEFTGVLWRNGPAEHERYGHRYGHWFDGDGMVQAFTFTGTGVAHRARILNTPKRRRETQAGRRILPTFATLPPDPAPVLGPNNMNAANTAMLAHGGRLMALWEGGSALEVNPETLAAGRFVDWSPDLAGLPFSAHPKVEPDGTIRLDLCQAPDPAFVTADLRAIRHGELRFPSTHPGYRSAVLKPGGAAEIDDVEPGTAEFPRIDPRRTGRRHHMVFALTGSEGDWPFRRISCLDPERGAVDGGSAGEERDSAPSVKRSFNASEPSPRRMML